MHIVRRLTVATLSLFLAGFAVVGTSGTAHAEDAYAYWLYYTVKDAEFVYQENAGPATFVPEDGGIEAYRYAAALFPPKQQPRADLAQVDFDTVCGDTAAEDGKKRVAVIIDYGIDGDAPSGDTDAPDPVAECAVVDASANGLQTLQSVVDVRADKDNAVCGIGGYPSSGDCFALAEAESAADGEPVDFAVEGAADTEASSDSAADEDGDSNLPLLVTAGVVVVALGAGGVVLARRGRSAA